MSEHTPEQCRAMAALFLKNADLMLKLADAIETHDDEKQKELSIQLVALGALMIDLSMRSLSKDEK